MNDFTVDEMYLMLSPKNKELVDRMISEMLKEQKEEERNG